MPDTTRQAAEQLWEELGGDLCICQRPEVPHWCEGCQERIDKITTALAAAHAEGRAEGLREAAEIADAEYRKCYGYEAERRIDELRALLVRLLGAIEATDAERTLEALADMTPEQLRQVERADFWTTPTEAQQASVIAKRQMARAFVLAAEARGNAARYRAALAEIRLALTLDQETWSRKGQIEAVVEAALNGPAAPAGVPPAPKEGQ